MRDNIAFGRPDSTDDEIWQAVRSASPSSSSSLPEGIHSYVHERGATLSAWRAAAPRTRADVPRRSRAWSYSTKRRRISISSRRRRSSRARRGARGLDDDHHRPPALDRDARRPHRRRRRRPDRRARIARRLVALDGHYAEMYATWLSHGPGACRRRRRRRRRGCRRSCRWLQGLVRRPRSPSPIIDSRCWQLRVEAREEIRRLMVAEVEGSPGARALAQVNGHRAEPGPPLSRRATEIEGDRRMRVEPDQRRRRHPSRSATRRASRWCPSWR